MSAIRFDRVTFAYGGGPPVLSEISLHLAPGWTGVVGANGAGKSTLLALATGALAPTRGVVVRDPPGAPAITCAQRVDTADPAVAALAGTADRAGLRWMDQLALDPAQLERWPTLSPGERKRWQIGAALAAEPDILALDEPTNHVDAEARDRLVRALGRFRGIGLLVSHDRELLDALPAQTVRVERGAATRTEGGYTAAREAWAAEAEGRLDRWRAADQQRKALERQLDRARRAEAAASRLQKRSARMKSPKDSDARSILATNLAEWAASRHGRQVAKLRDRADEARAVAGALATAKAKGRAIAVGWEPPERRRLVSLDGVPLVAGDHLIARGVRAIVERDSRIHLAGPNGAGKSTLLARLAAAAAIPPERVLWLAQERTADDGRRLAASIAALDPATRGRLGQLAAALGLDPDLAVRSALPSPGEARKLELALGLARSAWLLLLDEPTNHLDLPSIERIEAALADYPGALVLVSHDAALAERVTSERWTIGGGVLST
jgi:ATPase subunit of ABC transporter with duplicated ATPase domains